MLAAPELVQCVASFLFTIKSEMSDSHFSSLSDDGRPSGSDRREVKLGLRGGYTPGGHVPR